MENQAEDHVKKLFGIMVSIILLLLLLSGNIFADSESEPNNKKADADDLLVNTQRTGTISDANDEDWYRITVPAEGTLCIDFTYSLTDAFGKCWSMRIYQEDGLNYLIEGEYWSYRPNQREDPVEIDVKAGTYYIKIADDRYHSSEPYTLCLSYGHDCETYYSEWSAEGEVFHLRTCSICQRKDLAEHTWDEGKITVPVSCTQGSKTYTCLICSAEKSVDISQHNYGEWQESDSLTHKQTCTVCQDTVLEVHLWNDGEITKTASCKEEGIRIYTCTVCGAQKEESIPKTTDHFYDAWLENDSVTHQKICAVCQDAVLDYHQWNEGQVTKPASCKDAGIKTYTCLVCSAQKEAEIPKTADHSYGGWQGKDHGTHQKICSVCQDTILDGHQWNDGEIIKAASCNAEGKKSYTCGICSAHREEIIPKTNEHRYGLWTEYDVASHKQSCSDCEKTVYEVHQWDQGTPTQTPSCAEESVKSYQCTVCSINREEKIRLPHEEVHHSAQVPTCTAIGWEAYVTCAYCTYTTYREFNALGHSYDPHIWGYAEEAGHGHLCQRENCSAHDTLEPHTYAKNHTCQFCGYRSNTASGCAAATVPTQTVPLVFPGVALAGVLRKKKSRRS